MAADIRLRPIRQRFDYFSWQGLMITRRDFSTICAGAVLSSVNEKVAAEEGSLADAEGPRPIVSEYFPDRVHEFVFRNWTAVQPAKLADVLGCSISQVKSVAESMGLSSTAAVPREMIERGYTTIIKRNWHLLPLRQ